MDLTVIDEAEVTVAARVDGDRVWIAADALEPATGWVVEPEGLCRGAVCVPTREPVVGDDGAVDLVAVTRALGKQMVVDVDRAVAAVADDPMGRGETRNLHELSLPDLDGRMVDLSGNAGKKVVLIAWASW